MNRFFSRRQARLVAIAVTLVAMLSFAASAGTGVAHAASLANQQWWGAPCGPGCGDYLGYPSTPNYSGQIHTFNAMDKCLEVPGSSFYTNNPWDWQGPPSENDPSGAQVQLYDCQDFAAYHDYDKNQWWHQVNNGDGTWGYYLQNDQGFFCLDSLHGHNYNGSPVQVWRCNGGSSQQWTIGPGGQLQSVDSPGFCLDDTDWNPNNGAQMQLWQCAY